MRYERLKTFSALLSLTSAMIALGLSIDAGFLFEKHSWILWFATALAGISAATATLWSHRLTQDRTKQQVFLVYAREDLESARNLAKQLRVRGFNTWLDVDQLVPGQVWQKAVLDALEQSSAAIVLVSKNLSKKGFVRAELQAALDTLSEPARDLSPIIPVRLDESSVPEPLQSVQWVNLFDEDGIDRLESGLRRITTSISDGETAHVAST